MSSICLNCRSQHHKQCWNEIHGNRNCLCQHKEGAFSTLYSVPDPNIKVVTDAESPSDD